MAQKKLRRLELERRKRDETQMDVSINSGVDVAYICKAERYGKMYPGHFERIAKALDFDGTLEELLEVVE